MWNREAGVSEGVVFLDEHHQVERLSNQTENKESRKLEIKEPQVGGRACAAFFCPTSVLQTNMTTVGEMLLHQSPKRIRVY